MTNTTKTLFLFLALISGVTFLNSCNKSSTVSIVGTWTLSSERVRSITSGLTVLDTTYQIGISNSQVWNLKSNSSYTAISTSGTSSGIYGYTGGVLTLVDTSGGFSSGIYKVSTLGSNQLSLQLNDTTSFVPPTQVYIYNYNFSR